LFQFVQLLLHIFQLFLLRLDELFQFFDFFDVDGFLLSRHLTYKKRLSCQQQYGKKMKEKVFMVDLFIFQRDQ
jgi:hypothetical protein